LYVVVERGGVGGGSGWNLLADEGKRPGRKQTQHEVETSWLKDETT